VLEICAIFEEEQFLTIRKKSSMSLILLFVSASEVPFGRDGFSFSKYPSKEVDDGHECAIGDDL